MARLGAHCLCCVGLCSCGGTPNLESLLHTIKLPTIMDRKRGKPTWAETRARARAGGSSSASEQPPRDVQPGREWAAADNGFHSPNAKGERIEWLSFDKWGLVFVRACVDP